MASWMKKLAKDSRSGIIGRARHLSRSFLDREIQFQQQGRILRGTFRGLAADGGLRLSVAGREEKIFYNGEILG
jgi:biotin-(acetyl-CoA carboxylase) ligase